ncbi:hypothetical protein HDU76_012457 [Blyttiomyces sp. JEL0837]|nr:hypothetical protein HDU76_012457 [Blyttiomyces sp. JEL0837]
MADSPEKTRKLVLASLKAAGRENVLKKINENVEAVQSASQATAQPSLTTINNSNNSSNPGKRKHEMNLRYYDYNLTTMKDSRGGFIIEDAAPELEDLDSNKKQKKDTASASSQLPRMQPSDMDRCRECESMDVDNNYIKYYGILDYLLTESELKDVSKMPFWEKPNPHKSTYANMLLYLRMQVEAFAIEKWGSLEKLDEEFERREEEKRAKKEQKFNARLRELRSKTRTSTWQKQTVTHEHEFEEETDDRGVTTQICKTCGVEMEVEEL